MVILYKSINKKHSVCVVLGKFQSKPQLGVIANCKYYIPCIAAKYTLIVMHAHTCKHTHTH